MKVLLDTSIWEVLYRLLHKRKIDVEWVGHWEQQPSDHALLTYALEQEKIIVTLGEDLAQRIDAENLPHYGILQLSARLTGTQQAQQCFRLLSRCQNDLSEGDIVTFNENGISVVSPLPTNENNRTNT